MYQKQVQVTPFYGICLKKLKSGGSRLFQEMDSLEHQLYDFEFDDAPDPDKVEQIDEIGYYGGDIVLRLCFYLPKKRNFKLYFDNYFSYPELLLRLKMDGFWTVGTIRQDIMCGCKLKSEKELKKEGCGSYDGSVGLNSGIVILKWFDNKAVQLILNQIDNEPIDEVECWSKSARKMITISRPKIVKLYNSAMGGVDLFDIFQAFYRLDNKSRRWYMYLSLDSCLICHNCIVAVS